MCMEDNANSFSVYVHIFPNGRRYVGMTVQIPAKRWGIDGYGYKGQPYVFNAIKKYGWENIEHIIVQTGLTCSEAEDLERKLIKEYRSAEKGYGYNIDLGGNHQGKYSDERRRQISMQQKGRKLSPEACKRLSEARKGHPVSQETREKLRQKNLGRKQSEETRRKISEANKRRGKEWREKLAWYSRNRSPETNEKIRAALTGRKQSEETIKKRADALRGRRQSPEAIKNMTAAQNNRSKEWEEKRLEAAKKACEKPVVQKLPTGEIVNYYSSVTEAAKQTGASLTKIAAVCRGTRKTHYGFKWEYVERGRENDSERTA